MQRMRVDLPEPDGPQMTMRSPRATVRSILLSAWKEPYHLLTRSSAMMIGESAAEDGRFVWLMRTLLWPLAAPQLALDALAELRHEEAESEIDQGGEQIDLGKFLAPQGILERRARRVQEIEEADQHDQRGVLEGRDADPDQRRNDQTQGLRQ